MGSVDDDVDSENDDVDVDVGEVIVTVPLPTGWICAAVHLSSSQKHIVNNGLEIIGFMIAASPMSWTGREFVHIHCLLRRICWPPPRSRPPSTIDQSIFPRFLRSIERSCSVPGWLQVV